MRKTLFLAALAAGVSIAWATGANAQVTTQPPLGGTTEVAPPLTDDPLGTPPLTDPASSSQLAPPLDVTPPATDDVQHKATSGTEHLITPSPTPDPQGDGQLTERTPARVGQRPTLDRNLFDPGFQLQFDAANSATIGNVTTGSVAAQAGLQANDKIISIDGRTFTTADEFRTFAPQLVGRQVPVVIERNGQQQTIRVFYPQAAAPATTTTQGGAWLGVYLDESFSGGGARVARIVQGSPAARSELRAGDVVVSLNGQDVYDYRDFIDGVRGLIPNSSAEMFVNRDGRNLSIVSAVGRIQTAAYRGVPNDRGDYDFGDNRLPPSPDNWSQSNLARHEQRMERLERMIEQLQTEVRDLRAELNRQR